MRTVKLQMQMSVDGFIAGPNGAMDWMVWNWDEELKNYVRALTEPVDTMLLGRVLAQGFMPAWKGMEPEPESDDWFARRKMLETPKVVFSKTLESVDPEWEQVTLASGDLANEITRLKHQPGQDIIVYGGGSFVSSMIEQGLIDEFHLFVNPVALGSGMTIFNDRTNLTLVKSTAFSCGIVVLHYTK